MIDPSDEAISEQINLAYEAEDGKGSRWPGMSYEAGVIAALDWVTGDRDEAPMEDDREEVANGDNVGRKRKGQAEESP